MVDLNKKPLPDPRADLVGVLKKIAEKHEKEQIFKAIEAESKMIRKYTQSWTKGIIIGLLIVIWVPVIALKEKSSSIWEISYCWGVILPFMITFFMLCEPPGKELRFSNGAPVRVKGQWWKKIIYYILAWVPWYSCIVIRFNVLPLRALWVTPLTLILLIIWALFRDWYYAQTDPLGMKRITPQEYRSVRISQSSGGLNPDVLPPIFMNAANKEAIMRMTPQDWNRIAHQLSQAGYKIEENAFEIVGGLIDENNYQLINMILAADVINKNNIDKLIEHSAEKKQTEITALLLEYKNKHFGFTDINKQFRL